jgi:hypothetical protein
MLRKNMKMFLHERDSSISVFSPSLALFCGDILPEANFPGTHSTVSSQLISS